LLVETTTGHCKALIGPWLRDGIRWKSPDLTLSGLMPSGTEKSTGVPIAAVMRPRPMMPPVSARIFGVDLRLAPGLRPKGTRARARFSSDRFTRR
jgi:hypothetical protein